MITIKRYKQIANCNSCGIGNYHDAMATIKPADIYEILVCIDGGNQGSAFKLCPKCLEELVEAMIREAEIDARQKMVEYKEGMKRRGEIT